MEKSNIFAPGNRRKINPDWFTGPVYMKDISSVIQSQGHDIYHVHFERGAKTKLHEHNGNQILIAVRGKGKLEFFKKTSKSTIKKTKSISLNNGDIAYIPKNTLHTHGSSEPKKLFSHIAINILPTKKSPYKTVWYKSDFAKSVSGIVKS